MDAKIEASAQSRFQPCNNSHEKTNFYYRDSDEVLPCEFTSFQLSYSNRCKHWYCFNTLRIQAGVATQANNHGKMSGKFCMFSKKIPFCFSKWANYSPILRKNKWKIFGKHTKLSQIYLTIFPSVGTQGNNHGRHILVKNCIFSQKEIFYCHNKNSHF